MNKIYLVFIALVLATSFAMAAGAQGEINASGAGESMQVSTELSTQNQGAETNLQNQVRSQIQAGTYMNQAGEQMQIQAGEGNRIMLKVGGVEADCDMNMTQEQVQNRTQLKVHLSNGMNAEVKVMPNTASETALARLGAKCEGNCTIELKEVGTGSQTRAAYEIKTQKQAKVLGLFQAKMQVQAQVDAENGEIIQAKKPWWAFLATETA